MGHGNFDFVKRPLIVVGVIFLLALLVVWLVLPVLKKPTTNGNGNGNDTIPPVHVDVPDFNSDSAYAFVEKQVAFGPRVPGTIQHKACGDWLEEQLRSFSGWTVISQRAPDKLFTGQQIELRNIIASFNPDIKRRILLSAHWDTRMFADHDIKKRDEPILGANDGGSGVGVLLELARQISLKPIGHIGIDIVLFDAEDQGYPDNMPQYKRPQDPNETWCLGSQHWSKHRHRTDYAYIYGILLDMVGAEGAEFPREGHSVHYASHVVEKVWKEAAVLGYGRYFIRASSSSIMDDHYYINTLASIPTVDIIDLDPTSGKFHSSWHTHQDDMKVISRETLKSVGQTVLSVVYKEAGGALPL